MVAQWEVLAASQLQDAWFIHELRLLIVWGSVYSPCSFEFPPPPKNMQVGAKLPLGMNMCMHGAQ